RLMPLFFKWLCGLAEVLFLGRAWVARDCRQGFCCNGGMNRRDRRPDNPQGNTGRQAANMPAGIADLHRGAR
ncbi:TPA: hypothetical protein ACJIYB_004919, partial [Serratia marcescens]